jgi:RNase P subunit RPR2
MPRKKKVVPSCAPEGAAAGKVVEDGPAVEERRRFKVPPPVRPSCPGCGGERLLVAYTTPMARIGKKRVTANCGDCGAVCYWDVEVKDEA